MYNRRQNEIVQYLADVKFAKTEQLADLFQVSLESIRRDLLGLEKNHVINRVRGGAVYNSLHAQEMAYEKRMKEN